MVAIALVEMSAEFEWLYSHTGRPAIPPLRLLRALLLQIFYSNRCERMLMEQLEYDPVFRWIVGLVLRVIRVASTARETPLGVVSKFPDNHRELRARPFVAENTKKRKSALEAGATRHPGHGKRQNHR